MPVSCIWRLLSMNIERHAVWSDCVPRNLHRYISMPIQRLGSESTREREFIVITRSVGEAPQQNTWACEALEGVLDYLLNLVGRQSVGGPSRHMPRWSSRRGNVPMMRTVLLRSTGASKGLDILKYSLLFPNWLSRAKWSVMDCHDVVQALAFGFIQLLCASIRSHQLTGTVVD